jgi:DNA modification methylase
MNQKMNPDFHDAQRGISLYCGDAVDLVRDLQFDCMITDPPYGVKAELNSKTASRLPWSISGQRRKNDYGSFEDSVEYVRNSVIPIFEAALALCGRAIVTPGNRCLTLYPMPDSFGCFYQPASVGLQRWGRCDAQPILYYGSFPRESRMIPGTNCSYVLTESPEPNGHPCPKPIKAWTRLVVVGSLEGETVLDPFMGSATTGISCIRSKRKFIGIEKSPEHFTTALSRIQRELAQGVLAL